MVNTKGAEPAVLTATSENKRADVAQLWEAVTASVTDPALMGELQVGNVLPQDNVEGEWIVCSPESISEFSAVAYFFGKKLHKELGVPIGLIHSSWGGSPAESWARTDFIEKIKGFENTSKRLEIAIDPKSDYNYFWDNIYMFKVLT